MASFVLAPSITNVVVAIATNDGAADNLPRDGTITVTIDPPVGKDQRLALLLNEFHPPSPDQRPPRAYRFPAPSRNVPAAPTRRRW